LLHDAAPPAAAPPAAVPSAAALSGRRLRLPFLVVVTAVALVAAAVGAAANVPIRQVGFDRYTNVDSQHRTAVEADTFSFRSTIVSAYQVGRFFNGGASNNAWSTSTDAGATWVHGVVPGITKYQRGTYDRATDPVVAYAAKHNAWLISSLALVESPSVHGAQVVVNRSTNGGTAWSFPISVGGGRDPDKNWTVCDNTTRSPFYGNCYTQWDDHGEGNLIYMSTSTDGGLTWSPPATTANRATGLGGQPLVQPNGTVVVPIDNANETAVRAFRSTDGGASWSAPITVTGITAHRVAGSLRSGPLISAEIDGWGRIFVVWHDCRFQPGCSANDIVLTTSTDGLTWTPVTRLPIGATSGTVDRFIPGIGVDRTTTGATARVGVTYHYYPQAACTPSTCQIMVAYISSADGGATWSTPLDLAGPMLPTWFPNTTQGYMLGDYVSTSFAGGTAHPVFAVANAPSGALFDVAMYTPVSGLPAGPSASVAGASVAEELAPPRPPATEPTALPNPQARR
jgi:hypothetical protein